MISETMINLIKKILAKMSLWLYGPPCTYTSCYADKEAKERQGTRNDIKAILPESKKKPRAAVH